LIAGFNFIHRVQTVDRFGQDPRAGCLSNTPWTTKQKSLGQLIIAYGILKSRGDRLLPDHRIKGCRPVFSCRYDEIVHKQSNFPVSGRPKLLKKQQYINGLL
jgi:hypothetical protein